MKFYDKKGYTHDTVASQVGANIGFTLRGMIDKIRGKKDEDFFEDDLFEDDVEIWDEEVGGPEPGSSNVESDPSEETIDSTINTEAMENATAELKDFSQVMYVCKCGKLICEKRGRKCAICGTVTSRRLKDGGN